MTTDKISSLALLAMTATMDSIFKQPAVPGHSFAISPRVARKCHQDVIAGLDPAIHLLRESSCEVDGCPGQARA
jgi:hypothetical protein